METNVFIGHHCPKCKTTIGTYASVGGKPVCLGCGGPLIASKGGPSTTVIANATCEGCGAKFGLVSVVGGEAKCPQCGRQIS
jgi:ribosomal protein S27E